MADPATIGELAELSSFLKRKKQRRPTTAARLGRTLSDYFDGPEGWAKQLIEAYRNADSDTTKGQLAGRISAALEALDQWEREEPEVVPSELTDDQLVAAVEYLMNNKNALADCESRPFGT